MILQVSPRGEKIPPNLHPATEEVMQSAFGSNPPSRTCHFNTFLTKLRSYELSYWSTYLRLVLSPERETAYLKSLPNNVEHMRMKTQTSERNVVQSGPCCNQQIRVWVRHSRPPASRHQSDRRSKASGRHLTFWIQLRSMEKPEMRWRNPAFVEFKHNCA